VVGWVGGPGFDGPGSLAGLVAVVVGSTVVSFLVGGLNPATLFARILGKDLRGSGSGNPGATNAGRVLGVKWGVVVGLLDVVKGYLPTWLALHFAGSTTAVLVGLAVVAGHMFSPFLHGKGGKGVATTLGAMCALAPWYSLVAVVTFAIGILVFRITGVGSMITCAVLVVTGILGAAGLIGDALRQQHPGWVALVGALVLWRHRANLRAWLRTLRSR
jgi:glycerol-3-phosphate acyltransferase PlsY